MNHSVHNRYNHCSSERTHRGGGSFLGTILVIIGIIWLLKEAGWHWGIMGWNVVGNIFTGMLTFFGTIAWIIGIPIILLIAGIILIAGRRTLGSILVIIGILLLLNHFIIPGLVLLLFTPLILIILGILIITRLF